MFFSSTGRPPALQAARNKHISYVGSVRGTQDSYCKCVAGTLHKLPHPPVSFSSERLQAQSTEGGKGCGTGSSILGTHWPQQHVSFHASFIHFITSLEECEGVEEKPRHPETGEGPYSIFSSPGPACSLHARLTLLCGGGARGVVRAGVRRWRAFNGFGILLREIYRRGGGKVKKQNSQFYIFLFSNDKRPSDPISCVQIQDHPVKSCFTATYIEEVLSRGSCQSMTYTRNRASCAYSGCSYSSK